MRSPYVVACRAARSCWPLCIRRLLTERVSAFADLEARMGLSTACGAFLLPALADGLLDLWFGGAGGSQANESWLIRLLDGTLGVNAAE